MRVSRGSWRVRARHPRKGGAAPADESVRDPLVRLDFFPRALEERRVGIASLARNVRFGGPDGRVHFARLSVCLVLGVVAAVLVVPPKTKAQGPATPTPVVLLDKKPLPLDGDTDKTLEAARAIAREYVAQPLTVKVEGGRAITRPRSELGARVDPQRLVALVAELRDPRSAMRRAHDAIARGKPLELPLPVGVDDTRAQAALLAVKDELDHAPANARLDFKTRKVLPDQPGHRVDVHATLARLDAAIAKGDGEITALVETIPASRTADQIREVRYDDVLGYFTTKYARDNAHEARTFNLRIAASKLDGHVLMPGEVFDFNQVVGPRDEANGYKVATVISQGELVDGMGGGTCQISGTLHGAAFFSGLEVVERRPHTRPSGYIKMGMDSTVVYPTITLKLRNPFPFAVVLHEVVENGEVRAEVLGPPRTRDVTFFRKISQATPFKEKEIPDAKVPKGERVLVQRGIPGFAVTRYRIVRDGPYAAREKTVDSYPPTVQIWRVGTGEADKSFEAKDDAHAEYVADEMLTITQGPSARPGSQERGGATVESRVAGKYGSYGWTVREGFTQEIKPREGKKKDPKDPDNPGVD